MGIPKRRQKLWRFEQMWLEDEGCKDIVELAWGKAFPYRPIDQVEGKIKSF